MTSNVCRERERYAAEGPVVEEAMTELSLGDTYLRNIACNPSGARRFSVNMAHACECVPQQLG